MGSSPLHLNSSCSHFHSPVVTTFLVFSGENLHNLCRTPPRGNNSRDQFPNKQDQLDPTPISPSLLTISMLITSSQQLAVFTPVVVVVVGGIYLDRQKEVNSRTQRDAISNLARGMSRGEYNAYLASIIDARFWGLWESLKHLLAKFGTFADWTYV